MSKKPTSPELPPGLDHSNLKLLSKSTPLKTSVIPQNGSALDIPSPPVPSKSSITTNKATNLSHVPCKFFKQGACTAGTNCTFSHNPTPTSEASVCKYFIKGNCKFGAKCALLHTMSPYGEGRKFLTNRFNANGGGGSSLLQQQQQQQQQQQSAAARYQSNGFSQLTAAIQQQHDQRYQQQQTSRTLATSTPTSNPLAHYLQHNNASASLKHHGITGLRTSSTSIWDTPTSQSYDQRHDSNSSSGGSLYLSDNGGGFTNNNNSFFGTSNGGGGSLQQIPEIFGLANVSQQQTDPMMDPDDICPSSTAPGHHYSHSHDTRPRLSSSRFFQNFSTGGGEYSQKSIPSSHSQSYTIQGQPPSCSSFDRFGAPVETNDSNIWNNTYRFSSSLSSGYPDLMSAAHAINIPSHSERCQQTSADDVDITCHFTRYPRLQQQQQQQQQMDTTSFYTSTPEPSFIKPSIIGSSSYQQQQQQQQQPYSRITSTVQAPDTRNGLQQPHEDSDVPFFMDDTDDVPIQQQQQQQQQDASLDYASFTSLVRPTY